MSNPTKKLGAAATAPELSRINTLPEHVDQDNSPPLDFKQCGKCLKRKPVSDFARNTKTDDGRLKTCIACIAVNKRPSQSLRQAINAKCRECIYDPNAGGGSWRKQTNACTSSTCPLFDVRPTSRGVS